MARPQNSPRGLFQKERIDIGSQSLTYNSTGLILSSALTTGGALTLGGALVGSDATGAVILDTTAALPGNVTAGGAGIMLVANSTGTALVINTTGTTWVYANTTTANPAA